MDSFVYDHIVRLCYILNLTCIEMTIYFYQNLLRAYFDKEIFLSLVYIRHSSSSEVIPRFRSIRNEFGYLVSYSPVLYQTGMGRKRIW